MSISIKLPQLPPSGLFKGLDDYLESRRDELNQVVKQVLLENAKDADYDVQSGRLMDATKVTGDIGDEIRLYVDSSDVDYGSWIITGQRNDPRSGSVTWRGDPFIDNAIEESMVFIQDAIEKWLSDAINDWNKQTFSIRG